MGYSYPQLISEIATGNVNIIDSGGNALLEITKSGDNVTIEGTGATGGYLILKGNNTDTYPKIELRGAAGLVYQAAAGFNIFYKWGTSGGHYLSYAAGVTSLTGGGTTADDLKMICNNVDTFPYIHMQGDSDIYYASKSLHGFYTQAQLNVIIGDDGYIKMLECDTPSATTNYGAIYTKSDNKLYFQDGGGTEHEVQFV